MSSRPEPDLKELRLNKSGLKEETKQEHTTPKRKKSTEKESNITYLGKP